MLQCANFKRDFNTEHVAVMNCEFNSSSVRRPVNTHMTLSCYLYDNVYMKALNARIISFNIAFINTVQLRNMSAN